MFIKKKGKNNFLRDLVYGSGRQPWTMRFAMLGGGLGRMRQGTKAHPLGSKVVRERAAVQMDAVCNDNLLGGANTRHDHRKPSHAFLLRQ